MQAFVRVTFFHLLFVTTKLLSCLILLLLFNVALFCLKHLHSSLENDEELITIVSLMKDKLFGMIELVSELAAHLRQMFQLNLALFEELILFDEWN